MRGAVTSPPATAELGSIRFCKLARLEIFVAPAITRALVMPPRGTMHIDAAITRRLSLMIANAWALYESWRTVIAVPLPPAIHLAMIELAWVAGISIAAAYSSLVFHRHSRAASILEFGSAAAFALIVFVGLMHATLTPSPSPLS